MLLSLLLTIFSVVELNCENIFDFTHDEGKQDEEFLPDARRGWDGPRYWKKLNHIGQEIISCGDMGIGGDYAARKDTDFMLPDLVALCEVENDSVLVDLTQRSLLRNAGYQYVMTDSPDIRGVDVALLYNPFSFALIDNHSVRVTPLPGMRPTRDILYVKGRTFLGDTLHVMVVHAPSRGGGEVETEPNRMCVVEKVVATIDSIRSFSPEANIIIAGDFNDYACNRSLQYLEQHGMKDVSANARGVFSDKVTGTYKFRGEWGCLDHILLSPSLLRQVVDCHIHDAPFLLTKDDDYGGVQPFRTFTGIKWHDGFSDHLPLVLRMSGF